MMNLLWSRLSIIIVCLKVHKSMTHLSIILTYRRLYCYFSSKIMWCLVLLEATLRNFNFILYLSKLSSLLNLFLFNSRLWCRSWLCILTRLSQSLRWLHLTWIRRYGKMRVVGYRWRRSVSWSYWNVFVNYNPRMMTTCKYAVNMFGSNISNVLKWWLWFFCI